MQKLGIGFKGMQEKEMILNISIVLIILDWLKAKRLGIPNACVVSKTRLYDKGATLEHPQGALLFSRFIRKFA